MAAEAFVHTKVRGSFDHSLLAFDMSWKDAAGFGSEELLGALQHLEDLTHLGKAATPANMPGVT